MAIKEKEVRIEDKYVRWFSDLSSKDVKLVGGKAANLGEMLKIKMPVPQGFVIIASAYEYFLEKTDLKKKIYEMLKIDVEDTKKLEEVAKEIRNMIENASIPKDMGEEIVEAYEVLSFDDDLLENATPDALNILKRGKEPIFVAVRSSATAEDSSKASFAGQQETFLNVKGKIELIEAIKKCFASLFTARSIYYRIKKGFKHEDVLIAVVVQVMVNSDKSGVIFSRDPVKDPENIVIEAVFGLGEGVVSGRIQPDHYLINRDLKILEKKIADKKVALFRNSSGKTELVRLTEERSKSQVLSEYEIKLLANYALKLEEHYNSSQDIEFAVSSGEIHIVQTRPVTTLGKKVEEKERVIEGKEILSGISASPGIASGEVKLILDLKDLNKIKKGDILVTKMTNPDMVVSMQKSSAIITDEGGMTSHAAIVSREMGIPCVVGTKEATEILKEGQLVTVDGFSGKIYLGKLKELEEKKVEIKPVINTNTRIKVIVDLPDFAERAAKSGCKDVGLVRLEGIIAESGKHPFYFLNGKIDDYEKVIFSGLKKIAEYFDELWIRTSDIRSDEFRHLLGAPKEVELNPMLGMHGIRAGLKFPALLEAELKAMEKLADTGKKIGVMMPQIINIDEVFQVKDLIDKLKIKNLKLGVMIETPAAVQVIEDLCKSGIEFISFGTNDLTQYTLAIDRGNEEVQYLYDEMNPAVLSQLVHVISVCKENNVETSICGQAASSEKMVEFLVKQGIDSLSVNADKAYDISVLVKRLEDKGLRGSEAEEAKEEKKVGKKIEDNKEKKKEESKEEEKEEWQDVDFGIDVFANQQETEKWEEKEEKRGKEAGKEESFYEEISGKIILEEDKTEEDEEEEIEEVEEIKLQGKDKDNDKEEDSKEEGVLDIF